MESPDDYLSGIIIDALRTSLWASVNPPLVFPQSTCVEVADPRNLSPAFVPREQDDALREALFPRAVASALDLLSDWPTWSKLSEHLGQLILLHSRGKVEPTNSYTLTLMPCVVYADTVDDPGRMGEIIAHETAHNRLNELLLLCGRLPQEPQWWSPWKGTIRPAFGLLHAAYAFSHVVLFLRWLLENCHFEFDRTYAANRLRTEYLMLRSVEQSMTEAVLLVDHSFTRKELMIKFDEACCV
jgi:HEXXH motif-containing protein